MGEIRCRFIILARKDEPTPDFLWRMMQFYETYRDKPKLSALLTELSWTHNLLIRAKCKPAKVQSEADADFLIRLARPVR